MTRCRVDRSARSRCCSRLHLAPQVQDDATDNVDAACVQLAEFVSQVLLRAHFLCSNSSACES